MNEEDKSPWATPAGEPGEGDGRASPHRAEFAEDFPTPVLRFLLELAAGLKGFAMYPGGHPALDSKIEELTARVRTLLASRRRVAVRVGREHLTVGSNRTEVSNPLLASVAERLHDHHLAAVTFHRGVQPDELRGLLEALGREPDDEDVVPLGRKPDEGRSSWPHLQVQPLDYDPIELAAEVDEEGVEGRLLEEADLPFSTELAGADLRQESASSIAERLEERLATSDEPESRLVAVQIFRLTENLATAGGEVGDALRDRMSSLMTEMETSTVTQLLRIGRAGGRREEFIRTGAKWMKLDAVVQVVEAAVEQDGAEYGESLLQVVSKMSSYTPEGVEPYGAGTDAAIRDLAQELVEDWELEDPRPEAYSEALEELALGEPTPDEQSDPSVAIEPERTVKTGIELNDLSPPVRRAVSRLLAAGEASRLLDALEDVPEENRVGAYIWERLSTPECFDQLVRADPPNFEVLDGILDELGLEVADSMLQVYASSEEGSVRRKLFTRLVDLGPELAPRVAEHLEHAERWYVTRNLLSLLVELGTMPEGVDLDRYLGDDERRIRTEAVKLAIQVPGRRERAICAALRDPDERLVRLGLEAAEESCPPAAETFLTSILRDSDRPDDLRASAARVLGRRGPDRARRVLSEVCLTRRWLFWTRLAKKSPVLLTALSALAREWPDHPEVRQILERARESEDAAVREAARTEGSEPAA